MSFDNESNKKRKIDDVSSQSSISEDELLLKYFKNHNITFDRNAISWCR